VRIPLLVKTLLVGVGVWASLVVGCYRESVATAPRQSSAATSEPAGPVRPEPIPIDMRRTGATDAAKFMEPFQRSWPERRFTFLVTGVGTEPKAGGPVERKAAAIEAAVVDAIGLAAREVQRDPKTGRAPVEYKLNLGPGLTVFGQLVRGMPQTAIVLDRRGRIYEMAERNGTLLHPPHDSTVIQQVFTATNGKLVLQATRATDKSGQYCADIGYYETVGGASSQPATATRPIIATGR
jgi:hypothetical protein